ncbi:MAG TPA: sensor histidine kinase [Candidatus Acidoferrales bacterium]|nr:sensor histidine kinase [Candidatus Acidoferrales bacterium]
MELELDPRQLYSRAMESAPGRSPTLGLFLGLVITLAAVVAYSWYVTLQVAGLRALQSNLVDRNRRDSLQLLRIQDDLNSLGLAMRDMLDNDEPYPLTAWSSQFQRIRTDLDDAMQKEQQLGVTRRTPDQNRYLESSLSQFWDATDRTFSLARDGKEKGAREQIRLTLQARQSALSTAVARLLVENNESEELAAKQVAAIYDRVQRQAYIFLGATLTAILLTSLFLIRSNRRLFAQLAALSNQRSELAQQLISTQESTLRYISRELHDEFGQILTAVGSMLGRAEKHAPEGSPLRSELREVNEIAQATLDNVRTLSQALHPVMLDEAGLESTVDWYIPTVEKQNGIVIHYEKSGTPYAMNGGSGVHVYRILQEALNNVARHSGAKESWVRMRFRPEALELEIEDHGKGFSAPAAKPGIGLVAMRERAELLHGTIQFSKPAQGGTLVRLRVPREHQEANAD